MNKPVARSEVDSWVKRGIVRVVKTVGNKVQVRFLGSMRTIWVEIAGGGKDE